MSKEKKEKWLTKELKYDDEILLGLGVVSIVMAVLVFTGVINADAYVEDKTFGILLVLMGVIAVVISIKNIVGKRKLKSSVYYKLLKDYENKEILTKLSKYELKSNNVDVNKEKCNLNISISDEKLSAEMNANERFLTVGLYLKESYILTLTEEEMDKESEIEFYDNLDPLKTTEDEVYLKLVTIANKYIK